MLGILLLCMARFENHPPAARWRGNLMANADLLLTPREAASALGVSYATIKQWIYAGKLKTIKTPGGHHRVPENEIDRLFPQKRERGELLQRRGDFRRISGRNQLIGRVRSIKFGGLLAQITLAIGEQKIT